MRVGDFELIEGYGNKDWIDNVTKDKIAYWGKYIYALYHNDSGSRIRELICHNHVNFNRNGNDNGFEGILINNTSRDMLTAGSILDRFIKQVVPTIKSDIILPSV